MKASGKRILSILTSILMLIAALFVYAYFVKPVYSQINKLRTDVASRLSFIDKHENYIQEVKRILNEYQDVTAVIETTSLILPMDRDIASGLNQIYGLALLNKLKIESLDVQDLAIKPSSKLNFVKGIGTLKFNFRLSGSYENFKAFLQAMETNITLMDLMDFRIDSVFDSSSEDFYYTINLNTYYQVKN